MNRVTGHTREEVIGESITDRRRGMKLIACGSPRVPSPLRIDVDDELFQSARRPGALQRKDLPESLEFPAREVVVVIAALAGLAIGFLVGRSRES